MDKLYKVDSRIIFRTNIVRAATMALFMLPLFLYPQVGYMGKKLQAGYGFHFSPALTGSNGSGNSILGREGSRAETGELAFNSLHEGFVEYCIKNRTMIGFSAKYYKTTFDNRFGTTYIYTDPYYGASTGYGQPTGMYEITGLNYSLYFKFYYRKYLAPWGKYFMVGPSINTFKSVYDPARMKIQDVGSGETVITNFGSKEQEESRFDILVGFGRNRILADRVTIDYGVNFEAAALLLAIIDLEGIFYSENNTSHLNYIEKTSRSRVREVNRVNVFVKVGLLLF
jgi:hypothetical protein